MDFRTVFEQIHGYQPFPWQTEAARRLTSGQLPDTIGAATAAGKTAMLDACLFWAAHGGPRRIVFIVDRRVVVDEAYERARHLAASIKEAATAELTALAQQLGDIQVVRLRGGVHSDDDWILYPEKTTIVVSTVDQVGSRLLFRGYGVSGRAAPRHAGFFGNDCIYLVDEAHLSSPFVATVRAAQTYGADVRQITLSATPQEEGVSPVRLSNSDYSHPVLAPRLRANKWATLIKTLPEERSFSKRAAEEAIRLNQKVACVGVVVNRVATARRIWALLAKKHDAVLLTGRIRPYDRERLIADLLPRIRAGRERSTGQAPLFVVATQTVEVGAGIDFDALVTEAATLSALRQRFGRQDRLGQLGDTKAAILYRPPRGKDGDPIYGPGYTDTWAWLQQNADKDRINFGVTAMEATCKRSPAPVQPPAPAPMLLPVHLNLLAQTGLDSPFVDVSAWLHGSSRPTADVSLVWRADLVEGAETDWAQTVELMPPSTAESLQVPIYSARAWLEGRQTGDVTDLEGVSQPERLGKGAAGKPLLRWHGGSEAELTTPSNIRPGDTLVVPASYGGADRFGWHPEETASVTDVADHCQTGRRYSVRLVQGLCDWLGSHRSLVMEKVEAYRLALTEPLPEDDLDLELVEAAEADLRSALASLDIERLQGLGKDYSIEPHPMGLVLRNRPLDEVNGFLTGGVRVELGRHCRGVEAFANQLATSHPQRAQIGFAARLHDVGKAEPRFQRLLHGDPVSAAQGPLLAKSGMRRLEDIRASYRFSQLPKGFRHELASLTMSEEQDPLVRYLVGTHHGYGRPWFPVCEDATAEGAVLSDLKSNWAELFAQQQKTLTPWGLAGMELLLRAADARQSIAEQEELAGD